MGYTLNNEHLQRSLPTLSIQHLGSKSSFQSSVQVQCNFVIHHHYHHRYHHIVLSNALDTKLAANETDVDL